MQEQLSAEKEHIPEQKERHPGNGYTRYNKAALVWSGSQYFTLLEKLIDSAVYSIHLQVYIFAGDSTGRAIVSALCRAAARSVQVYVLADGYASRQLSLEIRQQMADAGIHFRWFEPLFRTRNFYVGRRLHHKVFVVDNREALVGGINIADNYNDKPGDPAWLDAALYVKGDVCSGLAAVCAEMWHSSYYGKQKGRRAEQATSSARVCNDQCSIRIRRNDWVKRKHEIWDSYFDTFNLATSEIIIMCSYFLPGWLFRKQMARAVKRGVKVTVILTGKSDLLLAKYGERFLYRWMLANNIAVYEYTADVLHAKMALRDRHYLTIGSYNVNNISANASVELNLDIRNKPFVSGVQQQLETIIHNDCRQITPASRRSENFLERCCQQGAFILIKALLYIFTWYLRQDKVTTTDTE